MRIRLFISMAVGLMVLSVLLGIGAITVLSVPALNAQAMYALPIAFSIAIVLTPVLSWLIAPRLRLRYWQDYEHR